MAEFVPAPVKPQIEMADLDKIDIRVGTIERVEAVPHSDKLVKLTVDFGSQRCSVLAGLRQERADPQAELEGRQGLSSSISHRAKWPAKSHRRCCSTSGTPTVSLRCSRSRKGQCPMARAQGSPVRSASWPYYKRFPSNARDLRGGADVSEA